ncbi:ABC transporter permease, partial [Patescibacteria group bacterium]|nr:ABC transporter permease [Patescibacteria group bacterium]
MNKYQWGIYVTRFLVREGALDNVLTKPINPLFRLASHTIDFLDLLTLIPVVGILIYVISKIDNITLTGIILYLLLCSLGLVIAMAIHIVIAALAVATQEIDNEIWIYRDLMTMGRFPIDI